MDSTVRYDYIAQAEPYAALDILSKHGYQLSGDNVTTQDIGSAIEQMVSEVGEPALVDIMGIHPDKGIIIELFATPAATSAPAMVDMHHEKKEDLKTFLKDPTNALLVGIGVLVALAVIKK
jgi:hypothetical protein